MSHDQPTYASVPGIRVYGMMCVTKNGGGGGHQTTLAPPVHSSPAPITKRRARPLRTPRSLDAFYRRSPESKSTTLDSSSRQCVGTQNCFPTSLNYTWPMCAKYARANNLILRRPPISIIRVTLSLTGLFPRYLFERPLVMSRQAPCQQVSCSTDPFATTHFYFHIFSVRYNIFINLPKRHIILYRRIKISIYNH